MTKHVIQPKILLDYDDSRRLRNLGSTHCSLDHRVNVACLTGSESDC